VYIRFATMGFTVEDRYLPLPTSIENVEGLALSQDGKAPTHSDKVRDINIILTSVNMIIKYNLQLKCMLVCCGRPLLVLVYSCSIVPVLTIFFVRAFSPLTFHFFSEIL